MKFGKLITLILALSLIVASLVAIGVTASAEEAVPTIAHKNLYYEANTSIAVQVAYSGTLPAGAKLGIIVWDVKTYDGTAATAIHKSFETEKLNGADFYLTQPIEAGNLSYPYMIAAAIAKADGTYVIGETQECSVVKYAYQKLGEKDTVLTTTRICEALIKYASAADAVITNTPETASFGYIKAVGGTLGNDFSTFGGVNGKKVILRGDVTDADGNYFSHWEDADGNVISKNRVVAVTVPADANGELIYTAVHTADAKGFFFDFESLASGELQSLPTSTVTKADSKDGYLTNTGVTAKYLSDRLSITNRFEVKPTEADATKYEFTGLRTHTEITGDVNKALTYWRDRNANNVGFYQTQNVYFYNRLNNNDIAVAGANSFELDVTFHTLFDTVGDSHQVNLIDATGKTVNFRINWYFAKIGNDYYLALYGENSSTTNAHYVTYDGTAKPNIPSGQKWFNDPNIKLIKMTKDESINVQYFVDIENQEIDITVDGEYFGSLKMANFKVYADAEKNEFDFNSAYINYGYLGQTSSNKAIITVDNVMFSKK